jgi:ubiquinone/menaquinone biosynthesis C-methylase UbiE
LAEFHFVEDYAKHVRELMDTYPLDEAMSRAVGGDFVRVGRIIVKLLSHIGMRNNLEVLDLGCGSGRVAKAISEDFKINYTGIDVVQDLLDYAKSICPNNYRFILNKDISIPVPSSSVDFLIAFSVFTHLLHEETVLYFEKIHAALRSNGKFVFSFLEFGIPSHWSVFEQTLNQQRNGVRPHLNMFMERNQIEAWSKYAGFRVEQYLDGDKAIPGSECLGQSVAVLVKKPLK